MSALPHDADQDINAGDDTRAGRGRPPGTPRWVSLLLIAGILVVALVVVVMLVGGGSHGPGMHSPGGAVPVHVT